MSTSIGAALRAARERRKLTLTQVAETTRIRPKFLQALEDDDLTAMTSSAQARGFLRIYAALLDVDLESLIPGAQAASEPAPPAAPPASGPPSAQTPDQAEQASRPGLLARVRQRLSGGGRREALQDAEVASVPEPSVPADEARAPEPEAQSAAAVKKKRSAPLEKTEAQVEAAPSEGPGAEFPPPAPVGPESSVPEIESTKTKADTSPDPVRSNATRVYSALGMIRARLSGLFVWPRIRLPARDGAAREPSVEGESADPGGFANAVDFNPLPSDPNIEDMSSDDIFAEIGRELRARREMLSLTYEEIERHTRIRPMFLKALDEGALDSLPSTVQTRGILANYAGFIDLDAEAVLLRFADGIQARHREQRPHWPPRTRSPMTVHSKLPPLRAFIASDLLFGGGAAIVLILFALWGINRVVAVRAESQGRPTAPSISDVLAAAPLPTVPSEVTLIPAQDTVEVPTLEATAEEPVAPVDPSITVELRLTATERTYLRVLVDDRPAFEGRTEPGTDYYYQAVRQIEVLVGNAAGIRVTHNGQDLGILGSYGEVLDQVYTARGVLTPTPTVPPTFTPSLTPTLTPRATSTLAPYTPTARSGE